jgi:hypothetical protein
MSLSSPFNQGLPSGQGATGPLISWPVAPGRGYQVQFKNNLSDPVWQNVAGNVTLIGGQGYVTDLAPNAGHRFYRIVSF